MKREIKFRGRTIGGELVTGNYTHLKKDYSTVRKGHYISNSAGAPFAFMVRPETVAQFTGLKDRNGKEIYEGDIESSGGVIKLGIYEMFSDRSGVPTWMAEKKNGASFAIMCNNKFEIGETIIGNIHESPELLNQ